MFLAPDRRVLRAKVDDGSGIFSGDNGSQTVESTVTMRAFAHVRDKQKWLPVVAKCGISHEQVVGVSMQKYEAQHEAQHEAQTSVVQ